jgi:hypothetical protein
MNKLSFVFFAFISINVFAGNLPESPTIKKNQSIDIDKKDDNYMSRSLNFVLVQIKVTSDYEVISFENPHLYFALNNGSDLIKASQYLGPDGNNKSQLFEVESGLSIFKVDYRGRSISKEVNLGPFMLTNDLPHFVKVKRLNPFTQALQVTLDL